MVVLKIQHSFQGNSGIARDQYVNTFHVEAGVSNESNWGQAASAVRTMFTFEPGGSQHPLVWYMSGAADHAGERVKIYDTSHALHSPPVFDELYTAPTMAGGASPLPSEVAVCLSYSGTPASGVPLSSVRGRIYIGPLSTHALDESDGPDTTGRPNLAFRSRVVESGPRLAASLLEVFMVWGVRSVTHNRFTPINHFWCDNAWDTQRRRGESPTSRVVAEVE
jgi:hypothetical protein